MYSVHQLAKLANISVRTLHHYDKIGLLKPKRKNKNNYREYDGHDLLLLQQILFFKELDLPLNEIKKIISRPGFDTAKALKEHRYLIELKKKRLNNLIRTIDKTIDNLTNKKNMNNEELYDAFNDDDIKQYAQEAQERWGNTDAYKQSMKKVSKLSKAEMDKLKEEGKRLTQKLADSMGLGKESDEVQALVAEHYKGIQFFYDCPIEMYRNLGKMYVDDQRFTAHYDQFRPGLARFLCDAIGFFCDQRK